MALPTTKKKTPKKLKSRSPRFEGRSAFQVFQIGRHAVAFFFQVLFHRIGKAWMG
jgi:hypothetical protein